MKPLWSLFVLCGIIRYCSASTLPDAPRLLALRDNSQDPLDPGWVKDFTAIGDSYAAGIGAGNVLNGNGDSSCSRYDAAYSLIVNNMGFGGKPKFTFLACSGDKSGDVMEQVKKIGDDSQDLVTVSAGGNDALLSDVLKACVFLPSTEDNCNSKLTDTKKAIDNDLLRNIDDLLQALAPKVRQGGLVVYTLYAQFFNADTDPCSSQTWNWFEGIIPGSNGIKLTKDLRKKLNDLVVDANGKIQGAIAGQSGSTRPSKLDIVVADWDQAVRDNNGRFCEPGSADDPADPSNAGLMFQRLNTAPTFVPPQKRLESREFGDSVVLGEINEARAHTLEKRIPDDIGKVFHPTILGQELIAATSMMAIAQAREKSSNANPPACALPPPPPSNNPTPECDVGRVSGLPANVFTPGTYSNFCEAVEKDPKIELNWIVDVTGNQIPPKKSKSKRSPPPNPSLYNDFKITLMWSGGDNACGKGCRDAFNTMTQGQCGRTAGEQNIMACSAKSDTNCGPGKFEYSIKPGADSKASCDAKPPTPSKPQAGPLVCTPYKKEEIDKCGFTDIHSDALDDAIDAFRSIDHGPQDVKTVPNRTQVYNRSQNPTYMLNVGYIPGCDAYTTQVIDNPQGQSGDPVDVSISYADIIRNTYKGCTDNNGLGGYQDYGCIRYGFYPTKIKDVFSDYTPKHYDYYWNAKNKWCGDG